MTNTGPYKLTYIIYSEQSTKYINMTLIHTNVNQIFNLSYIISNSLHRKRINFIEFNSYSRTKHFKDVVERNLEF